MSNLPAGVTNKMIDDLCGVEVKCDECGCYFSVAKKEWENFCDDCLEAFKCASEE